MLVRRIRVVVSHKPELFAFLSASSVGSTSEPKAADRSFCEDRFGEMSDMKDANMLGDWKEETFQHTTRKKKRQILTLAASFAICASSVFVPRRDGFRIGVVKSSFFALAFGSEGRACSASAEGPNGLGAAGVPALFSSAAPVDLKRAGAAALPEDRA